VITRRAFLKGVSTAALIVAVGGVEALQAVQPAAAQSATAAELMVPPPIGDRVLGKDDAPTCFLPLTNIVGVELTPNLSVARFCSVWIWSSIF